VTNTWTDGGIYTTVYPRSMNVYPKDPEHIIDRSPVNDMDFDSWINYGIYFYNCHKINEGGVIHIKVSTGY